MNMKKKKKELKCGLLLTGRLRRGPSEKLPKKAKKWPKMVDFQKYSHVWGVGTLNLSHEMSDKMQNESGQFNYTELRKRQVYSKCPKCQKNLKNGLFLTTF